jgi:hypothetical protein
MTQQVVRDANVYFLPAPTSPAPVATEQTTSVWSRLRARCRAELWRLRFACAGVRMAFRQPHPAVFADDAMAALAEQRAELIERRPRLAPARIIDLGSARVRLRPLTASH